MPLCLPKSICVVGAGPAGLAALKVISETIQHQTGLWTVVAYEARDAIGGVWRPAPPMETPPLTPVFDSLVTKVPHPLMSFYNFPFPPSTPLYPHASTVLNYLEAYATRFNLNPLVNLNVSVEAAEWVAPKWRVRLSTGTLDFDFLVVANGHFRIPRYPDTPGLSLWLAAKKASHSAWYRHPQGFGDVVLVVGGSFSGEDIAAEMLTAAKIVIHSVTGATHRDSGTFKTRGRVKEFRPEGEVLFEDGTTETGIDYCILATGYELSFPFFSDTTIETGIPPPCPPLPHKLYNSRYNVFPLAQHIFPLQTSYPPTSIAFIGLLSHIASFPLYESQAHAIVKVLAEPEALDITQEAVDIMTRHEHLRAEFGDDSLIHAKRWHWFMDLEQYDYRDRLHAFAGIDERCPQWMKDAYPHRSELRKLWLLLERTGEADEWVKGVGVGGVHEWEELLRRALRRIEENKGPTRRL